MQQHTGRDGVLAFLTAMQDTIELPVLELRSMFEDGDTVVSRLRVRIHFKRSGRDIDDDEWHVWTCDDDGLVLILRHLLDTKKH